MLVPRDVCRSVRGLGERVQAARVVSEQCGMNYLLCNITMQCKKTHTITKLKAKNDNSDFLMWNIKVDI